MGITRDQVKQASDITFEEVFVPEWLSPEDKQSLAECDKQLAALNGDDPNLRTNLQARREELVERGTCLVWSLTAKECEALQTDTKSNLTKNHQQNEQSFFARLIVACVRDKDGSPIFKSGDAHWIANRSFKSLNRIANVALKLSGLTKEDQDDILKN